jgi:hypothetical protein
MNSSKQQASENLARRSRTGENVTESLALLTELTNLRDDVVAFERFARRYPDFIHVSDNYEHDSNVGYSFGKQKTKMPNNLPKRFFGVWQWREALREIWSGNSEKLTELLLPSYDELIGDPDTEGTWPPQLKVDWQRGQFVYVPKSKLQEAIYALFRRSPLVKVCANSDCAAPYFIARKGTQRYCSDGCAQVFQRECKLRWWKEQGANWRRKRSGRKRGKR